jgi:hypothetical protein
MNTILYATFDGEVLRPDLPVRLPPNTRVRMVIETTDEQEPSPASFLDTAEGLNLEGPTDWSTRLEDYLYSEADRAD